MWSLTLTIPEGRGLESGLLVFPSLPVNAASVAKNTALTSTLTRYAAPRLVDQLVRAPAVRPPEDPGLCGLGGDLGRREAC